MERKIRFWVVCVHAVFILLMLFSPAPKVFPSKKHVAVRTLRPVSRPASKTASGPSSPAPRASSPKSKQLAPKNTTTTSKPKPKPTQINKPANKPTVMESQKKPKAAPKKAEPPEEAPVPPVAKPQLEVPTFLPIARVDIPVLFEESSVLSFEEQLVSYLHEALHLPEMGEVKIELTLQKNGSVEKIVVLHAESLKNKAYLEKNLPLLRFPYLEKKETLVFTFCNE